MLFLVANNISLKNEFFAFQSFLIIKSHGASFLIVVPPIKGIRHYCVGNISITQDYSYVQGHLTSEPGDGPSGGREDNPKLSVCAGEFTSGIS